ncbi:cytochrome P450 [Mycena galopus ATCC 62051]|nr:cytochrome P450 [Mycena galopus ATCC 62051]
MNYSSLALFALVIVLIRAATPAFPPWANASALSWKSPRAPTKLPWLTYTKWGLQYGSDIIHASALGQRIVVVNSVKTAVELFEKRSHIYSDRPVITMVELMGWDFDMGFMSVGDTWRQHRRMFQQQFRRDMSQNYRSIQLKKVHQLLQGLMSSPEEFRELTKTLAAGIIMSTIYGYEVKPTNDRFVTLSENALKEIAEAFFPGAAAVNTFPILRYLPSWMPGAGFQHFAAECRQLTEEMQKVPFDFVKQNMHDGADSKSVVAKLLEASQTRGRHDEAAIKAVAAVAYAAGADTTVSALASFFLAMAVHPDIQRKGQTEIDTFVGTNRLPGFEDRASLPFVEAIYREVLRWRPIAPLGMAHASAVDDIYNGYFIPKGATVMGNICLSRAMTRDESMYPEPERFNPDRFFTADGKLNDDSVVLIFGFLDLTVRRFGRRICPGRHNADATVWATIVSVLSTFNIAKAKDAAGNEIEIDPTYSDGFISHPETFACAITPRSDMARNLVQATQAYGDL